MLLWNVLHKKALAGANYHNYYYLQPLINLHVDVIMLWFTRLPCRSLQCIHTTSELIYKREVSLTKSHFNCLLILIAVYCYFSVAVQTLPLSQHQSPPGFMFLRMRISGNWIVYPETVFLSTEGSETWQCVNQIKNIRAHWRLKNFVVVGTLSYIISWSNMNK